MKHEYRVIDLIGINFENPDDERVKELDKAIELSNSVMDKHNIDKQLRLNYFNLPPAFTVQDKIFINNTLMSARMQMKLFNPEIEIVEKEVLDSMIAHEATHVRQFKEYADKGMDLLDCVYSNPMLNITIEGEAYAAQIGKDIDYWQDKESMNGKLMRKNLIMFHEMLSYLPEDRRARLNEVLGDIDDDIVSFVKTIAYNTATMMVGSNMYRLTKDNTKEVYGNIMANLHKNGAIEKARTITV